MILVAVADYTNSRIWGGKKINIKYIVLHIYFICKPKFSFLLSFCTFKYYEGQESNVPF